MPCEENENFYREIVKDLTNPTILLCYFARERFDWPRLYQQDQDYFKDYTGRDDLNFISAEKADFVGQINQADVIYLRGGDTEKLKAVVSKIENFDQLIKDKVVMGSSAGFYVLAKYYFSRERGVESGLGILPVKAIAHYDPKKNYDAIKKHGEDLEIVAVPEAEYVVREQ